MVCSCPCPACVVCQMGVLMPGDAQQLLGCLMVGARLDPAVKDALQRRARRHGRSMEEEVRQILGQFVQAEPSGEAPVGLGSSIVALYADLELEGSIPEWQGEQGRPALLQP